MCEKKNLDFSGFYRLFVGILLREKKIVFYIKIKNLNNKEKPIIFRIRYLLGKTSSRNKCRIFRGYTDFERHHQYC